MPWTKNKTCSKECSTISLVENQKKTNMERYGVENCAKLNINVEKSKRTCLERYGVERPLQNTDVLDKLKQTNIDRYGVEYAAQNKQIQAKNIMTNVDRYGVEYPYQCDVILNKARSSINQNKIEYVFSKTGYVLSVDQLNKLYLDHRRDYSAEYLTELVGYVVDGTRPNFDLIKEEYLDTRYYTVAKHYGYEFDIIGISQPEIDLGDWLVSECGVSIERNTKDVIQPYELDIYIPDHNLAIEFNGSYWHSEKYKDKRYHQTKTKMCNDNGITLIHIYEYLYSTKSLVYKNIIKSKLGMNTKLYARKCDIRKLSVEDERQFLESYHLQGYSSSSVCYGLYYNNDLVSLCSFGKSRFNTEYAYELIRNCTAPNITVVGGLTKLICRFKTEFKQSEILCYSDASISYNKGVELSQPNYVWWKNNMYYKRYQTMKHKLPKLLGDSFDPTLSEADNMLSNGFVRVYDSGNYKTII